MVINGCDSMERSRPGVRGGAHVQAADDAQMSALLAKTREAALSGKVGVVQNATRSTGQPAIRSGWVKPLPLLPGGGVHFIR